MGVVIKDWSWFQPQVVAVGAQVSPAHMLRADSPRSSPEVALSKMSECIGQ